jgi:hypothetical protein
VVGDAEVEDSDTLDTRTEAGYFEAILSLFWG